MKKIEFLQTVSDKFSEEEKCEFIDYLNDDLDLEFIEDFNDLVEELNDKNFFKEESRFAYYYNAINFLLENDKTLSKSIFLAKNSGIELKDIDSIELASLLKEKHLKHSFILYKEEINKGLEDCEKQTHCYCGEEIEEGDFCSKECSKHYFSEIT